LLIARLEPENNIEPILDGVVKSKIQQPFLVIGKHNTKFGEYLKNKYSNNSNIIFLGGIYNQNHLNNLRHFSRLYFHGHSVGGTNPSLLEAMASNSLIVANDNIFNKSILGSDAFYFKTPEDVADKFILEKQEHLNIVDNNRDKIKNQFAWGLINDTYEKYMLKCLKDQ
jgi:glycosyltransferase involved in cell wall biosynthesis